MALAAVEAAAGDRRRRAGRGAARASSTPPRSTRWRRAGRARGRRSGRGGGRAGDRGPGRVRGRAGRRRMGGADQRRRLQGPARAVRGGRASDRPQAHRSRHGRCRTPILASLPESYDLAPDQTWHLAPHPRGRRRHDRGGRRGSYRLDWRRRGSALAYGRSSPSRTPYADDRALRSRRTRGESRGSRSSGPSATRSGLAGRRPRPPLVAVARRQCEAYNRRDSDAYRDLFAPAYLGEDRRQLGGATGPRRAPRVHADRPRHGPRPRGDHRDPRRRGAGGGAHPHLRRSLHGRRRAG